MTNHDSGSRPSTIYQNLLRGFKHILALCYAAEHCATTFSWLGLHAYKCIPLLDFDVICGSLPSFTISNFSELPPEETAVLESRDLIGPYTTTYLLRTVPEFSLPPGTLGELLRRKQKLTGILSDRAKSFMVTLNSAKEAKDPSSRVITGTSNLGTWSEILLNELSSFGEELGDLELLEDLIDRETPISSLISKRPDEFNVRAFYSVYKRLNIERPDYTINNLHDALNVAFVIRIFNSPAEKGEGRRVPFLISETRKINSLKTEPEWVSTAVLEEPPSLFRNALYFVLTQGLLNRTDGMYRSAANEASILYRQAAELKRYYLSLIDQCKKAMNQGAPEKDISLKDMSEFHWSMLIHKREVFHDRWYDILSIPSHCFECDRAKFRNLVLTPTYQKLLDTWSRADLDQAIRRLMNFLGQSKHPNFDLWEPLQKFASQTLEPPPVLLENLFRLSAVPNDGTLLTNVKRGTEISELSPDGLRSKHDLRLVIHPQYVSIGALLAVDSLFDPDRSAQRYIRVTWSHNASIKKLWTVGLDVLRQCDGDTRNPDKDMCKYKVFTPNRRHEAMMSLEEDERTVDKLVERHPNIEVFEIGFREAVFCADVTPVESIEMQASFFLPASLWNQSIAQILAKTIDKTHIFRLAVDFYLGTLSNIMTMLRVSGTKMGKD